MSITRNSNVFYNAIKSIVQLLAVVITTILMRAIMKCEIDTHQMTVETLVAIVPKQLIGIGSQVDEILWLDF